MAKQSERQFRINEQFNEDLADVKTRQLFVTQALGATVDLLDGLLDRLVERKALAAGDPLISDFRKAIDTLRSHGLRLEAPVDPEQPVFQVRCPGCNAVLKAAPGQRVERCDWCGHVFSG